MKCASLAPEALLAALLSVFSCPVLAAGGAGADQPAVPASELQLAMTIFDGGISLGKLDLDATLRGSDYHAVSHLETSGVVNTFWQAQIQATSSGTLAAKTLHPSLYDSFNINHVGKQQEISLTYDGTSPPRLYADPPYSITDYAVTEDEQKATVDPLSAMVLIATGLAADASAPCNMTAPVFDGRRRYDVDIRKIGMTDVTMDNGLYKGPALVCEIKYNQIAGYKPRVLRPNEHFPVVRAWFATFPSAVTGRNYVVPLKVWAQTAYGVVVILASSLKIDGNTPKSGN